jgi:TetR/AcrR family transcriptional repressor of mexJK operon
MDLIAKHANVSKQTVYSHFGNKAELFAASIKQKCDSYQMTQVSLEHSTEPADVLFILAKRFVAMLTSKEALAVHKYVPTSRSHTRNCLSYFIRKGLSVWSMT